ncbi:CcdB family protein [Atlantibacter hermannii]|uniref:CcdB family protein n=1 Tax=Atlantibacter hermannii TaxID=565 RepID=UPI0028AC6356|nr:CcdB family protein [Atlantibacter hermannii]
MANVLKHVLVIPVIELARLNAASPPAKICPIVTILGQQYIAMTHMMAEKWATRLPTLAFTDRYCVMPLNFC